MWCKYWCQTQRARRSPAPRTTRERAIMCIAPKTQKHAGRSHNIKLLSGFSVSAFLPQLHGIVRHTLCTFSHRLLLGCHSPHLSLSSNFMLLFASQPSCLAACAIQAYWAEERQFGSTQLPADQCYSSHCHSL